MSVLVATITLLRDKEIKMDKTIGQVKDEVFEIVRSLHVAYMGDNRNEINACEKAYKQAQETYGESLVKLVQDYYNAEVIGKA
jgi:hypothetical protein